MHFIHRAFLCAVLFASTISSSLLGDAHPLLTQKSRQVWHRAVEKISAGSLASAHELFLVLLSLEPDFYPAHDTPPKIMAPFLFARRQFIAQQAQRPARAFILSATARDDKIYLTLHIDDDLLALTKILTVHLKTSSQSTFRTVSVLPLPSDTSVVELDFSFSHHRDERLNYFLDLVGRYDEPFYNIGSSQEPRTLLRTIMPAKVDIVSHPTTTVDTLKASWPILVSTAFAVAGALTYGLLKLNQ